MAQNGRMEGLVIRRAGVRDAEDVSRIRIRSWQWAYRGLMADSVLDGLSLTDGVEGWRRGLARQDHGRRGEGRELVRARDPRGAVLDRALGPLDALLQPLECHRDHLLLRLTLEETGQADRELQGELVRHVGPLAVRLQDVGALD